MSFSKPCPSVPKIIINLSIFQFSSPLALNLCQSVSLQSSSTVPPLFLHSFTIKPLDLHWSHTGLTLEQHCSYSYPTFVLRQMIKRYSVTALQWNPRPLKILKYKLFIYINIFIYINKIIFKKYTLWKITVTL